MFSTTFEEMKQNVRKVFLRLRTTNLKFNRKKCALFEKKVKYLGHVVLAEGITSDSEKIAVVKDWPIPKNKKQVRSFVGLYSYYHKFVKGFSLITKSLYLLTENQSKFEWNSQCQQTFIKLKQALISLPILSFLTKVEIFIILFKKIQDKLI